MAEAATPTSLDLVLLSAVKIVTAGAEGTAVKDGRTFLTQARAPLRPAQRARMTEAAPLTALDLVMLGRKKVKQHQQQQQQ